VGIYSSAKIVQATSHTGFVSFIDHNDLQRLRTRVRLLDLKELTLLRM
jgi:hypothetical protein